MQLTHTQYIRIKNKQNERKNKKSSCKANDEKDEGCTEERE